MVYSTSTTEWSQETNFVLPANLQISGQFSVAPEAKQNRHPGVRLI